MKSYSFESMQFLGFIKRVALCHKLMFKYEFLLSNEEMNGPTIQLHIISKLSIVDCDNKALRTDHT